jgi:radical SAM superfamily enzyme YgiQ (UPF0313 family)
MSLDVLLIQPPTGSYRRDDRCQSRVEDQTIQVNFPPMDLAYHAACLREEGHSCLIRDYSTTGTPMASALKEISELGPRLVFFSSTQPTQMNDLAFAARIKERVDQVRIVLRGESVTYQDEPILRNYPQVDYILRGESEETLVDLLSWLKKESQSSIEDIPGITYFSGNQIIRTPDRPFIKDLNKLPWPARDLLDQKLYRSPETGNVLTTLYTARGCPYPCIFCPAPLASGRPVRMRSTEDLVEELKTCVDRHGIREFLFHGDTFTYSRKWVLDLCEKIQEAGLKVRWGCNSRVDTIDPEMLRAMKQAGCWVIGFGVESGHEETLEKTRKAAKREDIVTAFAMCREAGIRSHAFFVFGFPWEGPEHLEEDLKLALEIDPDFFDLNIAYPLPGTELEKMVIEEGLIDRTLVDQGGYAVPATRTHQLSREELDRWRRKALLSLYLRPRYILRTFRQAGSPRNAWNYFKAGTTRLVQLLRSRAGAEQENTPTSPSSPPRRTVSTSEV